MEHEMSHCKGCTERHTACHDHCAKYAEWKADLRKSKDQYKEYKRIRREDYLRSEQCESKREKWRLKNKYGR